MGKRPPASQLLGAIPFEVSLKRLRALPVPSVFGFLGRFHLWRILQLSRRISTYSGFWGAG